MQVSLDVVVSHYARCRQTAGKNQLSAVYGRSAVFSQANFCSIANSR